MPKPLTEPPAGVTTAVEKAAAAADGPDARSGDLPSAGRQHVYAADGSHIRGLVNESLYYADHRVSGEPDHD